MNKSGFILKKWGPFRLVRWTKQSLVNALTYGKSKVTKQGCFTIWGIGISGYYITIMKTRTR